MAKLFIPIGIPGCGKTTFADRVLNHTNLRLYESDAIREEFVKAGKLSDVGDMSANKEVFEIFHARIEDSLLDGLDVFADSTNLRDFARKTLREIAERVGAETHVLVFTNISAAVMRNQKRNRVVRAEAMVTMLDQYELMLKDLVQETYSSITYIESVG